MINPFLKAGLLTMLVVVLALMLMSQIDSARTSELRKNIDSVVAENQANYVLMHYKQVMAEKPSELCPYLASLRQKQLDKTYSLATKIQDYERSNVLDTEYNTLKSSYFIALSDMYISAFENKKTCGLDETPMAFFYAENSNCPDCRAQDALMVKIAARCPKTRIYAFPFDSKFEPVQVIANRYGISSAPAIVINDKKTLTGLQGEESVVATLKEAGAACT